MAEIEVVPTIGDRSDTELLANALRGSRVALSALTDRHYVDVLKYLVSQSITPELASDLTHETFLDMFRSLDSIPTNRPLKAWLFVTARNNLLHHLRKERIRNHASLDRIMEHSFRPPKQLALNDPTLRFVDDETLRSVLDELSPNLREVMVLFGKGYSIKEAAEILDVDYQAARQRVSRAMRYIRARYVELGIFPEEHR